MTTSRFSSAARAMLSGVLMLSLAACSQSGATENQAGLARVSAGLSAMEDGLLHVSSGMALVTGGLVSEPARQHLASGLEAIHGAMADLQEDMMSAGQMTGSCQGMPMMQDGAGMMGEGVRMMDDGMGQVESGSVDSGMQMMDDGMGQVETGMDMVDQGLGMDCQMM